MTGLYNPTTRMGTVGPRSDKWTRRATDWSLPRAIPLRGITAGEIFSRFALKIFSRYALKIFGRYAPSRLVPPDSSLQTRYCQAYKKSAPTAALRLLIYLLIYLSISRSNQSQSGTPTGPMLQSLTPKLTNISQQRRCFKNTTSITCV